MHAPLLYLALTISPHFSWAIPYARPAESEPDTLPGGCDSSWSNKSADEVFILQSGAAPPKDEADIECRKAAASMAKLDLTSVPHCPSVFDFHVPKRADCKAAKEHLLDALGSRDVWIVFGQGEQCSFPNVCLPLSRDVADCRVTLDFDPGVDPTQRSEYSTGGEINHAWTVLEIFCTSWS